MSTFLRKRREVAKRRLRTRIPFLEILDDRVLLSANPIVTENQLPGTLYIPARDRLDGSSRPG